MIDTQPQRLYLAQTMCIPIDVFLGVESMAFVRLANVMTTHAIHQNVLMLMQQM